MNRPLAVILAMAALTGAFGQHAVDPASGSAPSTPPPVYVGAVGLYVKATQGSYCPDTATPKSGRRRSTAPLIVPMAPSMIICGNTPGYPLPIKGKLAVAPGSKLFVDAGRRARSLSARLVRIEDHGNDVIETDYLRFVRVQRKGMGRYWRVRLPADLQGANVLSLDISFRGGGDSNVWAGLAEQAPTSRIHRR
jgi:hypothetical protein